MSLTSLFTDIADAIREKDGTTEDIVASDFPDRILAIPTVGDGVTVESITITAQPNKLNYYAGETFDPTGMAVYANFSNGKSMYVNHSYLTFNPSDELQESDTSVTVSFQWGTDTVSVTQEIFIIVVAIFGVMWNYANNSSALTRLTPNTDPNNLVTATVSNEPSPAVGDGTGDSPFDNYMPWAGMEEYNIVNDQITYKKGDEGFSRIDHETVVYIPEFWYTCIDDETNQKRYWYISNKEYEGLEKHPGGGKYLAKYKVNLNVESRSGYPFYSSISVTEAISKCSNKGSKFYLSDITIWSAIQILYLVEYANWNSQQKIGDGVYSSYVPSGQTDIMTYHTGKVSDDEWPQIQYRGIEGIYGNAIEMIQGLKCISLSVKVSIDGTTYNDYGTLPYTMGNSMVVSKLDYNPSYKWVFIPKKQSGTNTSKYITDSAYISNNPDQSHYLCLGGYSGNEYYGGLFMYYHSSGESKNYGFRYAYDPNRT